MEPQIHIFQALADPARLKIVETMRKGACAVGDLVARMDIEQSGVSRHLRILTEAGIVEMRPAGQKRIYSLRKDAFDRLDALALRAHVREIGQVEGASTRRGDAA